MKILYLGDASPYCTSRHRALALQRLGHNVVHVDPSSIFRWNRWNLAFHYRTGFRFLNNLVEAYVLSEAEKKGSRFDLVWSDNGELVSEGLLRKLRLNHAPLLINYNCDDPTGSRDGFRWLTYHRAMPQYDLCVVVRRESEVEYPLYGARRVLRVWMSADEIEHSPRLITAELSRKWGSEVAFIGTWMPERGPFILDLIRGGVPISIWGNRWSRAREWAHLKPYWRGPALLGDEYAYAIQCSKINLGLLSKGNRDLHTQRSMEIPSLGAFFCAERTSEHLDIYKEGIEAEYWADSEECILKIKKILANDEYRQAIAVRGNQRFHRSGRGNEAVLSAIINGFA
jgi:spore maturation protein CgeB